MDPDTRYATTLLAELRDRAVPPLDVDVDRAVATGRRRVRVRRTVVGVVAAVTGLAVVAGTLVALDRVGARTDAPAPQVAASTGSAASTGGPAAVACSVRALPVPNGVSASTTAIDPGGRYVAGYVPGSEETGANGSALLWDGERLRDLGVPGFAAAPSGVNSAGTVVGTVSRDHRQVAWVYRNGTVTTLPALNGQEMSAEGINERGDIVGVAYGENDRNTAVVWPAGQPGSVRTLVTSHLAGAYDVAADGTAAGAGTDGHPFLWTPDGAGRQLPNLTTATGGTVLGLAGTWAYGVATVKLDGTLDPDPSGKAGAGLMTRKWSVRWNLAGDGRVEEVPGVEPAVVTVDGAMAGTTTEVKPQRPYRSAVVWRPGGAPEPLPALNAQRDHSSATAGTPDGKVIVGEESTGTATETRTVPVRWAC
ncbi:hypothetical protein [Virgisporangium ochraceum]|uniref:Extracellular repeat protein, HAF family n=1 Tax=Virgisporangium ochraceum TaxID=65505 RepID=A0A8J3ZXS1_9ACTN|nr:hypothetical protein [Virgisporangium ochraceum]GIJ71133.1 hypothetical protein Voc01_060500 [Virgisporangium ochraceum]